MSKLLKKSIAYLLTLLTISTFLTAINITPASADCVSTIPAYNSISWQAVRDKAGSTLSDIENQNSEFSPNFNEIDISDLGGSPIDWFSSGTGCDVFFRMQVYRDPTAGSGGNAAFFKGIWLIALGKQINGIAKTYAWVGVDGNGQGQSSYAYIYNPATATRTNVGTITGVGSNSQYGWIQSGSVSGTTRYWVSWKIPYSNISAITGSTAIAMFAGTSKSNSLSSINADAIDSLGTTPDYSNLLVVDPAINTTSCTAPVITSISPTSGANTGGTQVTITGTNLQNAYNVQFGSTNATLSTVDSGSVTVFAPSGTTNTTASVSLTTPCGTSTLSSAYTFSNTLTPTSVSFTAPASMTVAEQTSLTATVKNFAGSATLTSATGSIEFTYTNSNSVTVVLCKATPLTNGVGTCLAAPVNVSPITIKATYSGDSNYLGSNTTGSSVTPTKETTRILFTAPSSLTNGTPVTLMAKIYDPSGTVLLSGITGAVTFKNTNSSGAQLCSVSETSTFSDVVTYSGGIATCSWTPSSSAAVTIYVQYAGDSNYFSSSTSATTGKTAQVVTWGATNSFNFDQSSPYSLSGKSSLTYADASASTTYDVADVGTAGCTISGSDLTWTSDGTCDLSAFTSSTTNYNQSAIAVQTWTINKATALTPTFDTPVKTRSEEHTSELQSH